MPGSGDMQLALDSSDPPGSEGSRDPANNKTAVVFAESAVEVLKRETGNDAAWATGEAVDMRTLEFNAILGLTGGARGSIAYAIARETAAAIYGTVSGADEVTMDEIAHSAIGELANMITGRAAVAVSSSGATTDITPPVLIVGKGVRVHAVAATREQAMVETPLGTVYIELGLAG